MAAVYTKLFYCTQKIHTCMFAQKKFGPIRRIGKNLGPIHGWAIHGIMVDSAQRCSLTRKLPVKSLKYQNLPKLHLKNGKLDTFRCFKGLYKQFTALQPSLKES